MKTIYGVKMETPINKKLKNGHTMYDWVTRKNCFPFFCMRTLAGNDKITVEEIEFLKSKRCKIGLVLNNLSEAEISAASGANSAIRAVSAAMKLGVPTNAGIALFAEIKPEWSVNHNWMLSFAQNVKAHGFVAGFIGNTDSSKNFNFDRQASHFANAARNVHFFDAVFMATEPKLVTAPNKWIPYCPSAMDPMDMSFWACGITSFDEVKAENVYSRDENALANLW